MDLGVRPQHKMLWGEDLGPETDVDNPEVPRDSRPESSQGEVVDVSSESEEEEWKYVKGATKPEDKKRLNDQQSDNKSQLNPNASEFFPGIEKEKFNPLEKDDFIASSPGVSQITGNNLDDIDVPSETEFEHDISTRACDLESAADVDPDDTKKIENLSFNEEIKTDGVSLILTPQKSDTVIPESVQKIETNPFASDMEPSSADTDKVDFVQDYFGKSELDFKPFESVTPQHTGSIKLFDSGDSAEPHIPNSVSAEISYHFNFINSHLDNGEVEESEKERNQLEIKEPESPANSESCSNGVIEHYDHQHEVEDFPVDKTAEVKNVAEKTAALITKSVNNDVEQDIFEDKYEKDLGLGVTCTASNVLMEENDTFETKDSLCHNILETKLGFDEGSLYVSHEKDAPVLEVDKLDKHAEVEKESACEVVNNEPVITNFVEEVLSDISQTEHENKEGGPISGLDDFNFDSPPVPVVGDNNPSLTLVKENVSKINQFDQLEPIKDKDNLFDEDKDNLFDEDKDHIDIHEDQSIKEKDHIELLNGEKENVSISEEPFVSKEVHAADSLSKNEDHVEVNKHDSKPSEIESKHGDLISPAEEITCDISLKDFINPAEEIVSCISHENISSHNDGIVCNTKPQEEVISLAEEIVCDVPHNDVSSPAEEITHDIPHTEFADHEVIEKVDISDDGLNQSSKPELADTIGPNSFSFSQPYEVVEEVEIHRITPLEFLGIRRNDIMTTSMHESLEQDSSFEFNCESAVREAVIEASIDSNNGPLHILKEDAVPETISEDNEINTHKLENGIDHIESTPGLLSSVNENVLVSDSAIIECHEVPVSSEPDLVFVEHICPTVEVQSDEASPVNKENGGFDITPALSAAGITTALGAAAVTIAALPDQKEPEPKKEDAKITDSKISAKPSTIKASLGKKLPSSATTKPPVAKSAPKVAMTKTTLNTAKPKVPAVPKSAATSTVSKTRSVPLASKTSVTSTVKPAPTAAKPIARSTAAPTAKVPSKPATTSTKTLTSATKAATRPVSAPLKTSMPLSKPAAPTKTMSSASRAPLAAKKLPASTAKPSLGSKTNSENKFPAKTAPLKTTAPPSTRPSVPKTSTIGAKPPTRLGVSAVPANKLKATSPTKPAPIKAKSPLSAPKRPTSALVKKTNVLDKNAKNAVKSVPKETAQKEIITSENQLVEAVTSTTTNGHHIENGNVTPLEEISSHIM